MPHERIEIDSEVLIGKPVIRGTRVTVELVLRKLGGGMSTAELLDAHPRLTHADVLAALAYAADVMSRVSEESRGRLYLPEPG